MKEDEIIVQVQKINSEFYHAFENLSIESYGRVVET
jgi:hypothetical protein